jgi:hypothetical protein
MVFISVGLTMAFPQSNDIEEALLALLYLQGDDHHEMRASKIDAPLADYFDLSSEERFAKLADLRSRGLVDEEEYQAQWRRILNEL